MSDNIKNLKEKLEKSNINLGEAFGYAMAVNMQMMYETFVFDDFCRGMTIKDISKKYSIKPYLTKAIIMRTINNNIKHYKKLYDRAMDEQYVPNDEES